MRKAGVGTKCSALLLCSGFRLTQRLVGNPCLIPMKESLCQYQLTLQKVRR